MLQPVIAFIQTSVLMTVLALTRNISITDGSCFDTKHQRYKLLLSRKHQCYRPFFLLQKTHQYYRLFLLWQKHQRYRLLLLSHKTPILQTVIAFTQNTSVTDCSCCNINTSVIDFLCFDTKRWCYRLWYLPRTTSTLTTWLELSKTSPALRFWTLRQTELQWWMRTLSRRNYDEIWEK